MRGRFVLILCFTFLISGALLGKGAFAQEESGITINIFSERNGVGLQRDAQILKTALDTIGVNCRLYYVDKPRLKVRPADVNICFEKPIPKHFSKAKLNWYIPNPEWCYFVDTLDKFDLIICRTREVQRIFNELHCPTYYLGFTSLDRYDPLIQKNPRQLLHLAGKSVQKGTGTIMKLWQQRPDFAILRMVKLVGKVPELPNLIAFLKYVPEEDLILLQNQSGIHLCPSETEGFGHYIMEAMSTKSVILTTNAPPMNEFILDSRCLVAYSKTAKQRLGINYYVDIDSLEATIESILELSDSELQEIGERNRNEYLKRTHEFMGNLRKLVVF